MAAKKGAGKKGKKDKKDKKGDKAKPSKSEPKIPKEVKPVPVICQSNKYPGLLQQPAKLAVMGLKAATYTGLCQLLRESFEQTDRALLITPWGPYVVFREFNGEHHVFFLYDGCSCLLNIFRFYDLKQGTAGFLYFQTFHEVVTYVLENRLKREKYQQLRKTGAIESLCGKYCTQGGGGENVYKICNRRGELNSIDDHIVNECLFSRVKERCDPNSIGSIERELPSMKNQKFFKRILEGKDSTKKQKINCKK